MSPRAHSRPSCAAKSRRISKIFLALLRSGGAIPANTLAPIRSVRGDRSATLCRLLRNGFGSWSNWSRASAVYNLCRAVRITGALNLQALAKSFDEILKRHEALRTQFIVVEGRPAQLVAPTQKIPISSSDLRPLSPQARECETMRLILAQAAQPFDLAQGRLLRVSLLRQRDEEQVLVVTTHHLVADAWSLGILALELWTFYQAIVAGQKARLAALPLQYRDYAVWQRNLSPAACSTPASLTGKNSSPIRRCWICRLIIEGRRARVFMAAGRRLLCRRR